MTLTNLKPQRIVMSNLQEFHEIIFVNKPEILAKICGKLGFKEIIRKSNLLNFAIFELVYTNEIGKS